PFVELFKIRFVVSKYSRVWNVLFGFILNDDRAVGFADGSRDRNNCALPSPFGPPVKTGPAKVKAFSANPPISAAPISTVSNTFRLNIRFLLKTLAWVSHSAWYVSGLQALSVPAEM